MPDIVIRGVNAETIKRLKARARRNGRSFQSEVRRLLQQGAGAGGEEIVEMLDHWNRHFAGRKLANSAKLIREARDR